MRLTPEEYTTAVDEAERLAISEDIGRLLREYLSIRYHLKSREGISYHMCELCAAVAETGKSLREQEGMFKEMSVKELLIVLHAINIVLCRQKITRWLCPDCHNHSAARRRCEICHHHSCRACHKKLWSSNTICDMCSRKCRGCWKSYDKDLPECPHCQCGNNAKQSKSRSRHATCRAAGLPTEHECHLINQIGTSAQHHDRSDGELDLNSSLHVRRQKDKGKKKKTRKHEKTIILGNK